LVRTATLYERGAYAPYVRDVLERSDEILHFLHEQFPRYQPDKFFWVVCPRCGYIDQTHIRQVADSAVTCYCERCAASMTIGFDNLQGKLNWKLDCAIRWNLLNLDAEAFSKSYLEPQSGSYAVAQGLSQQFFGGRVPTPLRYGLVKMENKFSLTLLNALPPRVLRSMLINIPTADMKLTRDLAVTVASQAEVWPGLTYLDFVKQVLPLWLLTPTTLTREQRELVAYGAAFKQHFLKEDVRLQFPHREVIEGEDPRVAHTLHALLCDALQLRELPNITWEQFQQPMHASIMALGPEKAAVLRRLRIITGQQQGVPARRLLFLLPVEYLQMVAYMLELYVTSLAVASDVLVAL
jgi:hypothetical protein